MTIHHITNYHDRCGIADYAEHLAKALQPFEMDLIPLPIRWKDHKYMTEGDLIRHYDSIADQVPTGGIAHIQHEFGFFSGRFGMDKSLAIFGRLLERLDARGVRSAVTFHSIVPRFAPFTFKSLLRRQKMLRLAWRWKRTIIPKFKAGKCIAICHNKRTQFEFIRSGMPREATRVLCFPCAENNRESGSPRSLNPSQEAKARLGLTAGSVVLTSFGFISGYKGIATMAEALKCLPDNYVLVLAGDKHPEGSDRSLENILKTSEPGLWMNYGCAKNRRLIVTGYLDRAGINDIWDATDIVLKCYDDVPTYSMSAALPEALLSGRPVIASQIPAFKEVNEMGACLTMVTPGAAHELALTIQRLAEDEASRLRSVTNALRYAHEHTWERFAESTLGIYKELGLRA